MKIDLGLLNLDLPDGDELMAPVMLVAMGEKDEKEALSVGPTLAKAKAQEFRRMLTVNVTVRPEGEAPTDTMARQSQELMARVKGTPTKSEARSNEKGEGLLVEFKHENPQKMRLRSLCWLACNDRWLYTFNMTGLDDKKNKAMDAQMDAIIQSVSW